MRFPRRLALLLAALVGLGVQASPPDALDWPQATSNTRLWTRWWWLGSAVDPDTIGKLLTRYRDAGWGGVEICPIYGAKGYESRFIPYLSPLWMDRYTATVTEANRLGLGVDLTTGTGWPFGGPWIEPRVSSETAVLRKAQGHAGDPIVMDGYPLELVTAQAVSAEGTCVDVTAKSSGARLEWTPPGPGWTLYAVLANRPAQQVKRAAPGAQGNVADPFSTQAMEVHTARFDQAFSQGAPAPRAMFHDSYEYYGATWTPQLLDVFKARRGYDLRSELPSLFGEGNADRVARVKDDYRQTMAELHRDYIDRWTRWSHTHGSFAREQAHGAPANIEDVYATADIPETEVFGQPGDGVVPMLRFASSAAHVSGKPLASSETFTWLGEHFQVPLSALKPEVDLLFLCGINHVILHGTPYSPEDAPWPGWLFYASVNFGPNGGLWHDMPGFSAYVARCQGLLQAGRPDNDLLVYFPVHDYWQKPEGMLVPFTTPGEWMTGTPFHETEMRLWSRGVSFDSITDALLARAYVTGSRLHVGESTYAGLVVPRCRVMPVQTLSRLIDLSRKGARIAFVGGPPSDVPGLANAAERGEALAGLSREIQKAGPGFPRSAPDVDAAVETLGVARESMADLGLACIRRRRPDGTDYFIVNRGTVAFDGWAPLARGGAAAELLDPMDAARKGMAAVRRDGASSLVYLQLPPGGSCWLRTTDDPPQGVAPWQYAAAAAAPSTLAGPWHVHFLQGGPALPQDFDCARPVSWTDASGPEGLRFMGTARYSTTFTVDAPAGDDVLLDLGTVGASARVRLNGNEIALLWASPFQVCLGSALRPGVNRLEVDVTNLAANRIADLDRRHVAWKAFYEINFVNKDYKPFDASTWAPLPSGLIGPVTLTRLRRADPRPLAPDSASGR
jgi:alpha-L-rhamnosidase